MPCMKERSAACETPIDDPALIEKVAIAIFERTQGSWQYAREADREWLRLEAQAAIEAFLKHVEEERAAPPLLIPPRQFSVIQSLKRSA